MDQLYPPGPSGLADNFTAPGASYKRRSWIALLSLLLFIALYLSLTGWFGWLAYNYFANAFAVGGGPGFFKGLALGTVAAFLTVFLAKALFFVKHGGEVNDMEVTAEQQPELFEFLFRLADEAGAPRPHRVFLSPRVNAAVFYDLTLLNLLFPSKKNLEIGLALVNGLTLGELKAVLAHEFGHFRQGSMAVGRWVYVAQQVATHIIQERDILDRFLVGLSRFDVRIAWIGWILRLIVWSLRAILDTAFSLVVLAQRSLSREMEFHADLVSVSLTGSDALIHALHRLHAADDAWDRALTVAGEELGEGRAMSDIFVVQKLITQRMKEIINDEHYDTPPPLPDADREQHRVFETEEVHPPRMWSTHPPNHAREENAKRNYVSAELDDRPGWIVFQDAQKLREQMTTHILSSSPAAAEAQKSALTETVAGVKKHYGKTIFDRRYRGAYLGRTATREFATAQELFAGELPNGDLAQQFATLYPKSLTDEIEHWRNLEQERATLQSIYDGNMSSTDGVIRHRGDILKRRHIPRVLKTLAAECDAARMELAQHDQRVRSVHRAAAQKLGNGWAEYHSGLVNLLHYAEHSTTDVSDVHGRLNNLWAVVMADGKISSGEIKQLMVVANDVYQVISALDAQKTAVEVGPEVAAELGGKSWPAMLDEKFSLTAPTRDNIGDWLGVIDGWLNYFQQAFATLRQETLETLLATEARIESAAVSDEALPASPAAPSVPGDYATRLPNTERKLQTRLGLWDRFQTASGFFPGLARLSVAGIIVGGISALGVYDDSANVTIYNGLATAVDIQIAEKTVNVSPMTTANMSPGAVQNLAIEARTRDGALIESFEADASNALTHYVYNVAAAAPPVEWTAVYGDVSQRPARYLGTPRWIASDAKHLFEDPPDQINSSGDGGRRTVLSGFGDIDPRYLDDVLPDGASTDDLVRVHARWDQPTAAFTLRWTAMASGLEGFDTIIAERLQQNSNDVFTLRFEQDTAADADAKAKVCARHSQTAESKPGNADWQYLAIRCMDDATKRSNAYLSAYEANTAHPWLAGAAGHNFAKRGQWDPALDAIGIAVRKVPAMRLSHADTLARLRRMKNGIVKANLRDLYASSMNLEYAVAMETAAAVEEPTVRAYQLLAHGELQKAVDTELADDDARATILRLAAASDGAGDDLISAAKALDGVQGINRHTLWIALGFAQRHGLSTDALLAQLDPILEDDADVARNIVQLVQARSLDEGAIEPLLNDASVDIRGRTYALAVVALGDRAPAGWRDAARRLLFAYERPYFNTDETR